MELFIKKYCEEIVMNVKNNVKYGLKIIRDKVVSLYATDKKNSTHLQNIRQYEINLVLNEIKYLKGKKILEIGAGAGWQSKILSDNGFDVVAIDLIDTNYKQEQVFNVINYDGYTIPFENESFDLVFSSNVLEHIPHIKDFQKEIYRVLKKDATCIHLVPSSYWRFWTIFTELLTTFRIPKPHGEHAKNVISEIGTFGKYFWTKLFIDSNFKINQYKTNSLFYTGASLFDYKINIDSRKTLSKYLGSSCHYFVLTKQND